MTMKTRLTYLWLITIALIASFALCAQPGYASYETSLVSYWKFDDGSGAIVEDAKSTNDGTLMNSPAWTTGMAGGALSFNGSTQYVSMPAGPGLTNAATISFWVNTSQTEAQAINYPVSMGDSGSVRMSVFVGGLNVDSQNPGKTIGLFSGSSASAAVANSFTTPDYGGWHNIVVTYDKDASTKTHIYKDGVLLSMFSSAYTGPIASQNQINVGRRVDNHWYFNGSIDDLAIWNRALSADEVKAIDDLGDAGKNLDSFENITTGISALGLGYSSSDMVKLADLYAAGTGSTTVGGKTWYYYPSDPAWVLAGHPDIQIGESYSDGNGHYYIKLGSGEGTDGPPGAPEPATVVGLGSALLLAALRKRVRSLPERGLLRRQR
jgi:hypothetical protein